MSFTVDLGTPRSTVNDGVHVSALRPKTNPIQTRGYNNQLPRSRVDAINTDTAQEIIGEKASKSDNILNECSNRLLTAMT